jgi:large subunit ribosomal protein L4
MYRGAMRSMLSELIRQDRLVVVESSVSRPKTKAAGGKLKELGLDGRADRGRGLPRSSTWPRATCRTWVLEGPRPGSGQPGAFRAVLMTAGALKMVEEWLA